VHAPLSRAIRVAHASADTELAGRLANVRAFFFVSWHLFPLVWAAGCSGALADVHLRLGYVACDVVAKFLPVSLYVSLMTNPE
jgi:hypothetical protein